MSVDALIKSAKSMLAKSGESITITTTATSDEFDPITGEFSTGTPAQTFEAIGYLTAYNLNEVDGATVLATDAKLIMPATTPRIAQGWTTTVDGKTYQVINVKPIRKNGKDVIQIAQVRL